MFNKIQGNARGCLIFEPLFIIPYSMYVTYASVFMLQLGVSETGIGFIASLGLVLQIFTSFISGYLTDKMGRKKALLVYDLISWTLATVIWAVSQNFWFFLIAAMINSFQRIPTTAWYCLLVEDTAPKDRSIVFTVLQFIGVIGGLFAPLGGLLVSHYTLVPAVRIMYVIACISMTVMFFARNYYTHETEIGLKKIKENSGTNVKESLQEYVQVIKSIFSSFPLLIIFAVYILFNFQLTMRNTYLSIYLVEDLKLNDALISVFPAVSSAAMLLIMFFVVPRLKEAHMNRYMQWGFVISLLANLILTLAPPQHLIWIIISTLLAAVGSMITYPYLEAAVANAIDDENRAKVFSILSVLILVFISPSGIIGGWTYTIDPRIPFILIMLSFVISIVLMAYYIRLVGRAAKAAA